ncbi:hypothetical protein BDZ91DRAFT_525888 [Kalaharituber pfeilii]|nr:hypothetical protein BDZ91DRAFT_525888 [Kalaharituber pfeilii]
MRGIRFAGINSGWICWLATRAATMSWMGERYGNESRLRWYEGMLAHQLQHWRNRRYNICSRRKLPPLSLPPMRYLPNLKQYMKFVRESRMWNLIATTDFELANCRGAQEVGTEGVVEGEELGLGGSTGISELDTGAGLRNGMPSGGWNEKRQLAEYWLH